MSAKGPHRISWITITISNKIGQVESDWVGLVVREMIGEDMSYCFGVGCDASPVLYSRLILSICSKWRENVLIRTPKTPLIE
jgi:hypothetical protein